MSWEGRVNSSRDDPYADILLHARGLILPTETIKAIAVVVENDTPPEWYYSVEIVRDEYCE